MKKDDFGDRMKKYEKIETGRYLIPNLPVIVRIDGRKFSKFTKNFDKPFDSTLMYIMQEVTRYLVKHTNAAIGYTQSDEITLVLRDTSFFNGKIHKITSILASLATSVFMLELVQASFSIDTLAKLPHFDARVFQVPNQTEAANVILWRAQDARRNAISSACRSMYSTKQMYKKSTKDMLSMMLDKDVCFNTRYLASNRLGSYYQRADVETYPNVYRSKVVRKAIAYFGDYDNREERIFNSMNDFNN